MADIANQLSSGGTVTYSASATGGTTVSVVSSNGTSLASTVGGTQQDVINQLNHQVDLIQGDISQQQAQLTAAQQKLASATSPGLQNIYNSQISKLQSQIAASQQDLTDTQNAITSVNANYDTNAQQLAPAAAAQAQTTAAETAAPAETAADAVANLAPASPPPAAQNTGTDSSAAATDTVTPAEASNITSTTLPDTSQLVPNVSQTAQPVQTEDASTPSNNNTSPVDRGAIVTKTNPLNNYPNYTYGLTIHALDINNYNAMVNNPKNFKFTSTLISSAGRYNGENRASQFRTDFYFDDFKLETVIGLNANTRGTNAITGSFTLIEPYGMTLINRMLDLAEQVLHCPNYLQIPYVLEINFFGYDDSGQIAPLSDHTKLIPFMFTNMTMRASFKGTEYQCSFVPFSHQAYMYNSQSLPVTMEMTAATVSDFFNPQPANYNKTESGIASAYSQMHPQQPAQDSSRSAPAAVSPPISSLASEATLGAVAQTENPPSDTRTPSTASQTPQNVTVSDLPDAYNAWFQQIKKNGTFSDVDEIAFVVDDAIKIAKIAIPKQVDVAKSAGNSNDAKGATASARAADPVMSVKTPATQSDNTSKQTFSFAAGASINSIINAIVINSDYIINQLTNPEKQKSNPGFNQTAENLSSATGKKQVNWFKIIPKVELKRFDVNQNAWAKKITFYIVTYLWNNTRDNRAPISDPLPDPVRDYEYIYTGKNTDIINFTLDFNALFFTAIQVTKNQKEQTAFYSGADTSGTLSTASVNGAQSGVPRPAYTVDPDRYVAQSSNAPGTQAGANDKSDNLNASGFEKSIYSQLNGDMLNLDLEIIGDPDFIKQDELLYYPDSPGYDPKKQQINGDTGSLNMDSEQLFCRITFKTPEDIDETTGGLRYYKNDTVSAFSGLYHILTVSSELRQGKFTQKLHLVRQPNQTIKKPSRNDPENSDSQIKNQANLSSKVGSVSTTTTVPELASLQPPVKTSTTTTDEAPPSPPPASTALNTAPNAPAAETDTAALANVAQNGTTATIGDNATATGATPVGSNDGLAQQQQTAQKTNSDLQQQMQGLAQQNAGIATQLNQLSTQQTGLQDQADAIANAIIAANPNNPNVDIASGTSDQQAQYATLQQQISQNRSTMDGLAQQATNNYNQIQNLSQQGINNPTLGVVGPGYTASTQSAGGYNIPQITVHS